MLGEPKHKSESLSFRSFFSSFFGIFLYKAGTSTDVIQDVSQATVISNRKYDPSMITYLACVLHSAVSTLQRVLVLVCMI